MEKRLRDQGVVREVAANRGRHQGIPFQFVVSGVVGRLWRPERTRELSKRSRLGTLVRKAISTLRSVKQRLPSLTASIHTSDVNFPLPQCCLRIPLGAILAEPMVPAALDHVSNIVVSEATSALAVDNRCGSDDNNGQWGYANGGHGGSSEMRSTVDVLRSGWASDRFDLNLNSGLHGGGSSSQTVLNCTIFFPEFCAERDSTVLATRSCFLPSEVSGFWGGCVNGEKAGIVEASILGQDMSEAASQVSNVCMTCT